MEKCYLCEKGDLEKKKVDYKLHGVSLGRFKAEVCSQCGELFFNENVSRKMTQIAKEKGLFGLEAETKITQAGNSLAIRIPKRIVDFMHLKKGSQTRLHPEVDKLIIEFK